MNRALLIASFGLASAACASNPAKVPLAPGEKLLLDRIEALEADIEQLHAEMQELRVDYLPIAEMSESEFERHVEKRVANVPLEQREAFEKELRAKRKGATLTGKGLSSYWDDRFANEPTDDPWSQQADKLCRPRIEEAIKQSGGSLKFFECRKERCRAEIEAPVESSAEQSVSEVCKSQAGDEEVFGEVATTSHTARSNGKLRAVVFIARKGFSMKPE